MTTTPHVLGEQPPLYPALPEDYSQRDRPFTVTIAGDGRHNGEAPHVYVVSECSSRQAWAKALAWHMTSEETVDCFVVAEKSCEGVPVGRVGFEWNDLRCEYERQSELDDLADDAAERVDVYAALIAALRDEAGEVPPDRAAEVDQITAGYLTYARQVLRKLATLTGRD